MRYVDSVLQPGETIRHVAALHWILYVPGAVALIAGLLVLGLAPGQGAGHWIGLAIGLVLAAYGLYRLAKAWFERWITEIAVTNRRIIYKTGFIQRRTIEMHMDKVESVDVEQSLLGRLLDYGDVDVRGVGVGIENLSTIAAPLELRNHITAQ